MDEAVPFAVIGGLILLFGWYGFNPCSTLSINDGVGVSPLERLLPPILPDGEQRDL